MLEGLTHGQKRLPLFSDSEADHEQMGPIPSSNGILDIALPIVRTFSPLEKYHLLLPQRMWICLPLKMGNNSESGSFFDRGSSILIIYYCINQGFLYYSERSTYFIALYLSEEGGSIYIDKELKSSYPLE